MEKKKVLVVDDDRDFLQLIDLALFGQYEVEKALDVEEAFFKIRESRPPDVVLLDLMMPGISGIEMLQRMQSDREGLNRIPVVVVTAVHCDSNIKSFIKQESNVRSYLEKPLNLKLLAQHIQDAVGWAYA